MATDISELQNKVENEGKTPQGRISAAEWNLIVQAVKDNQDKYGYIDIPAAKQSDGYYHIYCYKSQSDYQTDVTSYVQDIKIPISTESGVTYSARLTASVNTANQIVALTNSHIVGLRFSGIMNDAGEVSNAGETGTLTFMRSVDGGSRWETVGSETIQSRATDDEGFDLFDIGKYFGDSNPQQIRVRVSYTVYDEHGNLVASPQSALLTWGNIIYTKLDIKSAYDFSQAVNAAYAMNGLPLSYKLSGEVQRKLHIKITGGTAPYETYFTIGANEYTNILNTWYNYATDDLNSYGLLSHGVRTIEAWLTCSDGTTDDALSTEHIFNQVMVDAGTDTTPRLLINNLRTSVPNYVPVNPLFEWAVWAPGMDTVPVTFRLEDYAGTTGYFEEVYNAVPGERYQQNATVEIEDYNTDTLYAYLVCSVDGTQTGSRSTINVDNTQKYAPTPGAVWVLNPKQKNNSGKNGTDADNTETIDGATATFSGFSWDTDGWVTSEDNQRVLRVPAGRIVNIAYDWLSPFQSNRFANVTMEFDMKVNNITNENDPIVQMLETFGSTAGYIGMKLLPLEGALMTATRLSSEAQDFRWQEGERVHIAVNIVSQLVSSTEQDSVALPLCRVFINGIINREFEFNTEQAGEWWQTGGSIIIGQQAADIDIYGIRVYHTELNNTQVLNDYVATIPDAAEKSSFRASNEITDGSGRVNKDRCQQKKINTLTWHGVQPTHSMTAEQSGWWEIHVFDANGDEQLEYSGTICQGSRSLFASRQGTTANTYYYSNLQTKLKSVKDNFEEEVRAAWVDCGLGTAEDAANLKPRVMAAALPYSNAGTGACPSGIWVAVTSIHEDYTDFVASNARTGYAFVPDGWIDGNGLYRGPQYKSAEGVPYATKLVGKINYASSMQSHLMAACRLYNDLHTSIVGRNSMQTAANGCRVAKYQELFLYFTQASDNVNPEFQGPITFGAGKMDDPTWGYNKSDHPMFCMIEGADNNRALTDMRIPWQSDRITVKPKDGEVDGYIYNGDTNLNMDRCKTTSRAFYVLDDGNNRIQQTLKGPSVEVENKIKEFINWIYFHDPSIKVFIGPWSGTSGFLRSECEPLWRKCKVWCTSGDDAYKLRRYDAVDEAWVEAGWDEENEEVEVLNLNTDETYASVVSAHSGDWNAINSGIIAAIAAEAKADLAGENSIINAESLRFHYCFVNQFLAGTDNCSKNTYYTLDPVTLQWFFSQDDMDTIIATDNSGFQSKPYYIDRQNPCATGSTTSLYEGDGNALFNLCEAMFEGTGELREMMRRILSVMSSLVSVNDNIPQVPQSRRPTPWGAMWKYFFSTQKRIPAVAYNETARIRYEYPKSLGFVSDRGVNPISQSMGDQLQSELQYVKRRLILMASYAEWGEFSVSGASSGNIGLEEAENNLGFEGTKDVNDQTASINFVGLTPHQWLWPSGKNGQTNKPLRQRCAPGEPVNLSLGEVDGDTACALYCSNYYRSFGNLGGISVKPSRNFEVVAKRLTNFTAQPTDANVPNFRPATLVLTNVPLLEDICLRNSSLLGGTVNLSNSMRLKTVDLMGCDNVNAVVLPKTSTLTRVILGRHFTSLIIDGQPNIGNSEMSESAGFSLDGYSDLTAVTIKGNRYINSYAILNGARLAGAPLTSVVVDGINWQFDVEASFVEWLTSIPNCELTGEISIRSQDDVTFDLRAKMVAKWPNLGDTLTINYTQIRVVEIAISGMSYVSNIGNYRYKVVPINPSTANSFDTLEWSVDWKANSYGYINELYLNDYVDINHVTGVLNVKQLSSRDDMKVTITATLDGQIRATLDIGLFFRDAEEGDYVFADGTWSDVADPGRSVVGRCIYNQDGLRLMITTSDIANNVSKAWGLVNTANGVQNITCVDGYNAYNVSKLTDQLNTSFQVKDDNTYYNNNTEEYVSQTNSLLKNLGWKTLTEDLSLLIDDEVVTFEAGTRMPFGKWQTLNIIAHRNRVLTTANDFDTARYPIPKRKDNDTEREDLNRLMIAIKTDGGANYPQFYFPAASICFCFEPTDLKPGEVLADHFKAHNWWLGSSGEWARRLWLRVSGKISGLSGIYHTSDEGYNGGCCGVVISHSGLNANTIYSLYANAIQKYNNHNIRAFCQF